MSAWSDGLIIPTVLDEIELDTLKEREFPTVQRLWASESGINSHQVNSMVPWWYRYDLISNNRVHLSILNFLSVIWLYWKPGGKNRQTERTNDYIVRARLSLRIQPPFSKDSPYQPYNKVERWKSRMNCMYRSSSRLKHTWRYIFSGNFLAVSNLVLQRPHSLCGSSHYRGDHLHRGLSEVYLLS